MSSQGHIARIESCVLDADIAGILLTLLHARMRKT